MTTAIKSRVLGPDIKAFIATSIKEVFDDPDFGLDLSEATKRRLRATKSRRQKWTSHAKVKKLFY